MGSKCTRCIPARFLVGLMAFFMFVITQMIRTNLNIAIVKIGSAENTTLENNITEIRWDKHTKSLLLSAFFWTHWITEVPGSLLAQRYGSCKVLLYSISITAFMDIMLPLACKTNIFFAIALRIIQGLTLGVTVPAMHTLSANWIPVTERNKFMFTYQGSSIGSAISFPLSGFLISHFGWECVFYLTGGLTFLWVFLWNYLIYDTPEQHPRISKKEIDYLRVNTGKHRRNDNWNSIIKNTPWIEIAKSKPFWAIFISSQGLIFGTNMMTILLPQYFSEGYQQTIYKTGIFSGIPEICKVVFGLGISAMMDWIIKKGFVSITSARKISIATCQYVPCLFLLLVAFLPQDNIAIAITLLSLSRAAGGASSGSLANTVDLSPNFTGILVGLIKTVSFIPGSLAPFVLDIFVSDDKMDGWKYVFIFTSSVYFVCCTAFMLFGSGEVQPWNEQKHLPEHTDMMTIEDSIHPQDKSKI